VTDPRSWRCAFAQLPLAGHGFIRKKVDKKSFLPEANYSISGQNAHFRPAQSAAARRRQVPRRFQLWYVCAERYRRLWGKKCTLQ
jgi:hypothetical protein